MTDLPKTTPSDKNTKDSAQEPVHYGTGDASYQAAGGEEGITKLVDAFYDLMGTEERFRVIYDMHPGDEQVSREKLARFLCGWLGGPRRYQEKFGPISIPAAHSHLPIQFTERDMWLDCMQEAILQQPFSDGFKQYLYEQLSVPAERVRVVCT